MTTSPYASLLDWLYSTQMFGFKLGLENTKKLLRQFKAYPKPGIKVIHVAGTNGKGSTCAIAEGIARASGYKTGMFTSPHLVDFRERMRVNGEMIPCDLLESYLLQIKKLVESWENHPTFFELSLALALKFFSDSDVEIIILETGMGGRLDATNAVPKDVAILTPISKDHIQWLGDNLESIAHEKADIIAYDKPIITSPQLPEVLDIIEQIANERRAPLTLVEQPLLGYHIALSGSYQQWNAALATAALYALGLPLRTENLAFGLTHVRWPGRFEHITPYLIIDGAHNEDAARILVQTWKEQFGETKTTLGFAAVEDKDIRSVLNSVLEIAEELYILPMQSPRALSPQKIKELIPDSFSGQIFLPENLENGLLEIKNKFVDRKYPALVCGSLYLIGEISATLTIPNESFRPTRQ